LKYLPRILKLLFGLILLGVIGIIIFIQTVDFSINQETIDATFTDLMYKPVYKNLQFKGRNIHYVSIGDTSNQTVLFVHGSPGSWDNFLGFLSDTSLLKNFHMIAVDRPGFGKSGNGIPEKSLEQQAASISKV
tara:strand:- start:2976 stop:3374 length:399 start_codon:yes stop_codon:yes gene_type:complete